MPTSNRTPSGSLWGPDALDRTDRQVDAWEVRVDASASPAPQVGCSACRYGYRDLDCERPYASVQELQLADEIDVWWLRQPGEAATTPGCPGWQERECPADEWAREVGDAIDILNQDGSSEAGVLESLLSSPPAVPSVRSSFAGAVGGRVTAALASYEVELAKAVRAMDDAKSDLGVSS
ncbi:MAG: hypothetical protein RI826_09945 [Chlorobium phaeovibrioides]|nr:hypothetical protein [Chlorobium phaeovibrioides]